MYVNKIILSKCKVWGGGYPGWVVDIVDRDGFLVAQYADGSINTVSDNSSFVVTWITDKQGGE
jgi:hypothetical protein